MDPITAKLMSAAGGAAADPVYVDDVFSTFLYDGEGAPQTITNGIDLSGEGGLVWLKSRGNNNGWRMVDTERGATKALESYDTTAEATESNGLTAFTSTGFSVGTQSHYNGETSSTYHMVSYTFRKAPGFFDVVTYTGNGSIRTIAHSLGSIPGSIWIKSLTTTDPWTVGHVGAGWTKYLQLNDNSSAGDTDSTFNDTAPTASVFTVSDGATNYDGESYVAYIFAHDDASFGTDEDESIIKCESYTGNGSNTGPVINVGFEPQFLIIKNTGAADNWYMFDNMRGVVNGGEENILFANTNTAEASNSFNAIHFTSTGFAVDNNAGGVNSNNVNYIYIAIRRPHKPPETAAKCFDVFTQAGSSSQQVRSGTAGSSVTDMAIIKNRTNVENWVLGTRLLGNGSLYTNQSDEQQTNQFGSANIWDYMSGIRVEGGRGAINNSGSNYVNYHFARKPGFFDIVAYNGTGSAKTESHNLGVVPEMMWVKRRSGAVNWAVYYGDNTDYLILNNDAASIDNNAFWNDTSPTASVFTVGSDNDVNRNNETYIAYLFATLPGISKVGSYTGTGSAQNIDCGFTNGARFVLIKGGSNSGNWTGFDTARGIASGNDPILIWNLDIAEITGYDRVDPLSSGFAIANTDQTDINASGRTYIFLAIA